MCVCERVSVHVSSKRERVQMLALSRVLRNVFETFLLISRTLSVCLTYTDERESAGIACKYKYSNFECGAQIYSHVCVYVCTSVAEKFDKSEKV